MAVRRLKRAAGRRQSDETLSSWPIRTCEHRPATIRDADLLAPRRTRKPAPERAPSTLSIIGRYILQPDVRKHLERTERGAGGEVQLTDALAKMIGRAPFHGYRFEGTRFDCGDKVGFFEANVAFAINRGDLGSAAREVIWRYAARCRP